MIVCHCNCITDTDIERAVALLAENDYAGLPTAESAYGILGKRMRCAGCMPHAVELIAEATSRCARMQSLSRAPAPSVLLSIWTEAPYEGQGRGHRHSQ